MQTWISLKRLVPFSIFFAFAASLLLFIIFYAQSVKADRVTLKEGDLFSISETLGERRLTNNQSVKILFDQKNGKVLFGQGWGNENTEPGEKIGGTELWSYEDKTGKFTKVYEGYETTSALLGQKGEIFFTTRNQDLMKFDGTLRRIQEKVLFPSISPDGTKLVYQKLPDSWELGEQYDGALGLTMLNLIDNREIHISKTPEDWSAIFTLSGKKVIFVSPNEGGLSSFFSMNPDGSKRVQLTNKGQKAFSEKSIPAPAERPTFSPDGRMMLYESDRTIWVVRFVPDFSKVEYAKRIAFGINPQWLSGTAISLVAFPSAKTSKVITVDLEGNPIK